MIPEHHTHTKALRKLAKKLTKDNEVKVSGDFRWTAGVRFGAPYGAQCCCQATVCVCVCSFIRPISISGLCCRSCRRLLVNPSRAWGGGGELRGRGRLDFHSLPHHFRWLLSCLGGSLFASFRLLFCCSSCSPPPSLSNAPFIYCSQIVSLQHAELLLP